MKLNKVFKVLGVVLVLGMLLAAIPASTALAALTITLDPVSGTPLPLNDPNAGTEVTVTGSGSGGGYYLYFSSQNVAVGKEIGVDVTRYKLLGNPAIMEGSFLFHFIVPDSLNSGSVTEAVHNGTYYVYASVAEDETIIAKASFLVTGLGSITISDDEGPVGTEVEITGTGMSASENLKVYWDGEEIDIEDGDTKASSSGNFQSTILVPESTYGEHEIKVVGQTSLAQLTETFSVTPSMKITPTSGLAGSTITINLYGFDYRNDVDIFMGATKIDDDASDRTSSDGSFTMTYVIPQATTAGSYTFHAEDEDDDDIKASATFTVTVPPLNPNIELNVTSGKVGDTVTVTGTEFGSGKNISLFIDGTAITPVSPIVTGSNGSFTASFVIPQITGGSHTLKAQDDASPVHQDTATFTVTSKLTGFTPTSGYAGTTISVAGNGFGASKTITIAFGAIAVVPSTTITTGTDGSLSGSFILPEIPGGQYTVTLSDGTNSVNSTFTVLTQITITPSTGIAGTNISITGNGFGASRQMTVTYNSVPIIPATPIISNSQGVISGIIQIPESPSGTFSLVVTDGTNTANASFAMQANVAISKTTSAADPGYVNQQLAITGMGYKASTAVTVTFDDGTSAIGSATTTDKGSFTVTFNIPVASAGNHTIKVSDGTNSNTFPFVMESNKPGMPQQHPLFSLEQPLIFDWDDVTDQSMPVTYTLQVATDATYSNIVLEKTGLITSGYTMTADEELAPQKTPYNWRVRSTDAAGNVGDWGPSATFVISSPFPSWLMWTLIGLGAFIVFIFAVWLGRRIAFSSY